MDWRAHQAPNDHPQRIELANEIHARPPEALETPERITYVAVTVSGEEREGSMIFSNHSCDPTIGVRGQIIFVAMRPIRAGEELTHDWAMTDDDDSSMACGCGAQNCRGTVTGKDWQRPELQTRYAGYFSSYLLQKINRLTS